MKNYNYLLKVISLYMIPFSVTASTPEKIIGYDIDTIKIGDKFKDVVAIVNRDTRLSHKNFPGVTLGRLTSSRISAILDNNAQYCTLKVEFSRKKSPKFKSHEDRIKYFKEEIKTTPNPPVYKIEKKCRYKDKTKFPNYKVFLNKLKEKYGSPDYIRKTGSTLSHVHLGIDDLSKFEDRNSLIQACIAEIIESGLSNDVKPIVLAGEAISNRYKFEDIDLIENRKHKIFEICPQLSNEYIKYLKEQYAPIFSYTVRWNSDSNVTGVEMLLTDSSVKSRKSYFDKNDYKTIKEINELNKNKLEQEEKDNAIPTREYGQDILGIRLGMRVSEAKKNIELRFTNGWRYDFKNNEFETNKDLANQLHISVFTNASIYISEDKKETLSIYYEPVSNSIVSGISRYAVGPFSDDIDSQMIDKYGKPRVKKIDRNFTSITWDAFDRKQRSLCNIGRSNIMVPLSSKVTGTGEPFDEKDHNNIYSMFPRKVREKIRFEGGLRSSIPKSWIDKDNRLYKKIINCTPTLQYFREKNKKGESVRTWISDRSLLIKLMVQRKIDDNDTPRVKQGSKLDL